RRCNLPEVPGDGRGAPAEPRVAPARGPAKGARGRGTTERPGRQRMRTDLRTRLARLAVIALAGLAAPARGAPGDDPPPAWTNDFTARLEALALLQTLNAELLSHDSATLTLDRWCDAHHLASPAKVVAVRERGASKPATA